MFKDKDKLIEYKANRNPVSFYFNEEQFTNNKIQLKNNDFLYLFSDGFKDQLNGTTEKKYTRKRFYELLLKNHSLFVDKQKKVLLKEYNNWKKDFVQVDDVTVLGIKWN